MVRLAPLLFVVACARPQPLPGTRAWPEAEAAFRSDPRWLGADANLSVPLSADRTLWLFGDTFVAKTAKNVRSESELVRNSVAVQTGLDVPTAAFTFHWRTDQVPSPASFFEERDDRWHWPGHGVRLPGGPLLVWLFVLKPTPGEGLGFADDGWRLVVVSNPDADPSVWQLTWFDGPRAPFDAVPASAVVLDGDYAVGLAIKQQGTHAGYLVRWRTADLVAGRLDGWEWWDGASWLTLAALGGRAPRAIIDDAGAESSLHFDAAKSRWVHVASYGFGASTIGVRTASALTGPWSVSTFVYEPPESRGANPFVYAAKAHPELTADGLVVTYATNSFELKDLFTAEGAEQLYWPRFVIVELP
ncbi:MAG: hypothetical protein JNK82_03075 [Myxococcaceae bacterium]|nr:hypothetical protein [Myxococcaceae bacterium]